LLAEVMLMALMLVHMKHLELQNLMVTLSRSLSVHSLERLLMGFVLG
jgi:hypothetical protein